MEQLANINRAQGLSVTAVHASQTNMASFLTTARRVLMESSDFLIVNYNRQTLHQQGTGHISPVAAYNAESNRFLILDVAAYKYPSTWVSATELWDAMNTVDSSSGESRGFLLVSPGTAD